MRAVVQNRFGGPEVLELVQVETPRPRAGEVLIRVRASGLNPVDAAVRSGGFPLLGEPPFALGWDVSGVVAEAGAETGFAVGDEVFGMPFFPAQATGYAEYVVAPAAHITRKPAEIDHVHAAALPLAALTAWKALVDGAGVRAGQRVLIQRAAGGVGHLAVQIAKARGRGDRAGQRGQARVPARARRRPADRLPDHRLHRGGAGRGRGPRLDCARSWRIRGSARTASCPR